MRITVPVLRVLEARRSHRTTGPLILRPVSGYPIDRRDAYRMVARIAKVADISRHIGPHSLRHAAITNALDAGVTAPRRPDRGAARRPTHYRTLRPPRGNLDGHGVGPLPDCLRRWCLGSARLSYAATAGSTPLIAPLMAPSPLRLAEACPLRLRAVVCSGALRRVAAPFPSPSSQTNGRREGFILRLYVLW